MKNIIIKVVIASFLISSYAFADDLINGQKIAARKCDKCHGSGGVSDDTDTPHLASQNSEYTIKQLKDYKVRTRVDKNMYKRAKRLDDKKMRDVAAWYETQLLPENNPTLRENIRTPKLVSEGDANRGIPPCDLCHGKDGKTSIGTTPVLAGQQYGYLVSTMEYFKDGSRTNDPGGAVQAVIKILSDIEIEALARYYSELGGREVEED